MKTINTQNLKGVTDYYGKEQIIRNKIINTLKETFENYGYSPLDSSVLYNYDILAYKYQDGAEILNEIYTLKDQGNRQLGLRYDLTIPFCKVISNEKELHLPFRRYEIGKVFRNGPVKLGRCREFYQCDIDVVGIDGIDIEVEQMLLVLNVFKKLGINIVIKWNNRKLMSSLIKYIGIPEDKIDLVIGTIDKLEKLTSQELIKEFANIGINAETVGQLLGIFTKSIDEYNELFIDDPLYQEALKEINDLEEKIEKLNIKDHTKFTPTLARGLSIYTGTVFEFYDLEARLTCSLGGGGRYNKIITDFISDGNQYPAVGLSFGLEPIYTILKESLSNENLVNVYIVPMGTELECLKLAETIRHNNINVLVELNKRKVKKCFEYANKEHIKYVIVVGSNEIESNCYTIKDMTSGEQYNMNEEELLNFLK